MSSTPSQSNKTMQLQQIKQRSRKSELGCAAKLNTFYQNIKEKLDKEEFVYSDDDLRQGIKEGFLQREKPKRPTVDASDKRTQCPNGVLRYIGPFPTTSATGEPNHAERKLGELNRWCDQEMGKILDQFMTDVNDMIKQVNGISVESGLNEIMKQIPGLEGKPINILIQLIEDYLEEGKKAQKKHDRKIEAEKALSAPDKPSIT